MRRSLRALPTLLRIGVAETVAYRAEFLVWILTTTMPLVMLALFSTVTEEAPFRGYEAPNMSAYYLAILIVRNVTGSWVAWQISEEIRMGTMSMRLLRPVHPFFALAASHAAAIPFRCVVVLPVAFGLLLSSGGSALATDRVQLALLVPSLALAWLITFAILFALGSVAFFITRAMGVLSLYFLLFSLLSGYLLPIPMLPGFLQTVAEWSPFRFMLSVPVELMTRSMPSGELATLIVSQVGWAVASIALAMWTWRMGIRRFEAVGA
jgi:ABC-2 type transport system permease protein